MNQKDWLAAYKTELERVAGITHEESLARIEAAPFEVLSNGFAEDPEGAARAVAQRFGSAAPFDDTLTPEQIHERNKAEMERE